MTEPGFPDVLHQEARVVTISPWFTAEAVHQGKVCAAVARSWETSEIPAGLISAHCFASSAGESILLYLQWSSMNALKFSPKDDVCVDNFAVRPFPNAPAYTLYRTLGGARNGMPPTRLICSFFDTDGPERQRYISDALARLAARLPDNPSAISSHFHHSLDGTRVVNYTEWRETESHDLYADKGDYDEIYRVSTSTPGVRSLRGNEYKPVVCWRR